MRRTLLLLLCTLAIYSCSQPKKEVVVEEDAEAIYTENMPTVAGVTFGSSHGTCEKILGRKFGEELFDFLKLPNELKYRHVIFAEEYFDSVMLNFQSDCERWYLNRIMFVKSFGARDAERATEARDKLFKIFSEKYEFIRDVHDDDNENSVFKWYYLGRNPKDYEQPLVSITLTRDILKDDNVERLWLEVMYGPINFIDPQDEI